VSDQETIFDRELRPIVFQEVMSMPTTILDGESHEDARRRRFQEEAAIDARISGTTLCWRCNHDYSITESNCPSCRATNANMDPVKAEIECNEQKAADEEWGRLNP
jgi:hypothetical protein